MHKQNFPKDVFNKFTQQDIEKFTEYVSILIRIDKKNKAKMLQKTVLLEEENTHIRY